MQLFHSPVAIPWQESANLSWVPIILLLPMAKRGHNRGIMYLCPSAPFQHDCRRVSQPRKTFFIVTNIFFKG